MLVDIAAVQKIGINVETRKIVLTRQVPPLISPLGLEEYLSSRPANACCSDENIIHTCARGEFAS